MVVGEGVAGFGWRLAESFGLQFGFRFGAGIVVGVVLFWWGVLKLAGLSIEGGLCGGSEEDGEGVGSGSEAGVGEGWVLLSDSAAGLSCCWVGGGSCSSGGGGWG